MNNEITNGIEMARQETIVLDAAAQIQGYAFFDRAAALEAGRETIANNPWMDARDVRDHMIYKLTGEAP
jgi:hypothetical protein